MTKFHEIVNNVKEILLDDHSYTSNSPNNINNEHEQQGDDTISNKHENITNTVEPPPDKIPSHINNLRERDDDGEVDIDHTINEDDIMLSIYR